MPHYQVENYPQGTVFANIEDNVENVHYREYAIDFHAKSIAPAILCFIENQIGPCRFKSVIDNVNDTARAIAAQQIDGVKSAGVPEPIEELLTRPHKKKEQVSLLKGVEISEEQLGAIFLFADEVGYLFSNMRFAGEPKKYSSLDVPSFIHLLDDGSVMHSGNTTLTDGQLKEIVEQSQYLVARVLSKGDNWHCFLQTRHGIMGQEPGQMGSVPHIHYISSSFGISLDDLKSAIQSGSYPKTPVHILLKQNSAPDSPENDSEEKSVS